MITNLNYLKTALELLEGFAISRNRNPRAPHHATHLRAEHRALGDADLGERKQ